MKSNSKLSKKTNLTTSSINNLIINNKQNMTFQKIIVPNSIISGECKLYKDNTHIADIVFQEID